jgi:hypothetical protein
MSMTVCSRDAAADLALDTTVTLRLDEVSMIRVSFIIRMKTALSAYRS